MNRMARALRSRPGRFLAFAVGCAAVGGLLSHYGAEQVLAALHRMAFVLPIALALEGTIIAFDSLGARSLYGPDRSRLRFRDLARSGLLSYVATALMPSGRVFGEATRATVLASRTTAARAAHAGYQMQCSVLVANSVIGLAALIATIALCGFNGYVIAIAVVLAGNLLLGSTMVLMGRRGRLGRRLGAWLNKVKDFGAAFDEVASESDAWPLQAIGWIVAGRALQACQLMLFIGAVSGHYALGSGLVAEGAHLVGAAAGELIPAQLGAQEGNFAIYASVLAIDSAGAVAVALSLHLCVMTWVLVGLVVSLVAPPEEPAPVAARPSEALSGVQ